jgi:MFS family permease
LIYAGFALYALTMLALPLAPNVALLLVPAMLFGVANGISIPSILTMLTELAPTEYRGAFMSVNASAIRMGQTLGPIVAGAMMQMRGLTGAYFGSALLALATLGIISRLVKDS